MEKLNHHTMLRPTQVLKLVGVIFLGVALGAGLAALTVFRGFLA
jgi:hypothetical protein